MWFTLGSCVVTVTHERQDMICYSLSIFIMALFQVYISAVGDEFNFLNNLEYIYDHSGSESETPGPFSRSYQALDAELDDGSVT